MTANETPATFRAFQADTQAPPPGGSSDGPRRGVVEMSAGQLPADGVLIKVEWSSVNYKDGLAATPAGKVARISPIVPGIDLAGELLQDAAGLAAGAKVIVHGYDLGVARHGGYAQYARVPESWIVPLPDRLTTRDAMVVGTGGFTSALSVLALLEHGLTPARGAVLVTGATGGVGSVAVDLLARLGFEVHASTGKPDAAEYLLGLGASAIVERGELEAESKRPLESTTWAGAVDCVGGVTLANVLKRIHYGGSVAASGLTGGSALPTTVVPFILRGVNLLGIDSVMVPIERRRQVWQRIATDLRPQHLDSIAHEIGLTELDDVLSTILRGGVTGRYVVDPAR